ncbi:tetratricopeptide repeat protein [Sphingomonas sp. KRR8]|uniref:SPOR domain-containing protein n=1 Tax=Sphingomonas sp. KRR8 TaxID=2942996 RepID=UPI002020416F|nr:SPOR domain-containing protein [Sphingomonas sp. KRR8]URD61808.1 tetratricopeptide repeat protein [Sphingomonas sp. KRR8]
MSKTLRASTALTAVAAASLIAGCASPHSQMQVSGGFAQPADLGKLGLATRALAALQAGNKDEAVRLAERAVEATPDDAGFRTLLGNVYLAQGRFASAETSFKDSLSLLPGQIPVAMKLVLAEIAQGKNGEALGMLDQLRGTADPADVGLAMALAGQPGNAVALLDEAARRPEADARTRQNLALAHAMAGDWDNARVVAAQDVPADQVDARMAEWMKLAAPKSGATQVASLIGVTPAASDPGQPVRLALRDNGGVRMAAATPAPAPTQVAAAEPAPAIAPAPASNTVMNDPGFAAPVAPVASAPVAMAATTVTVALPEAAPSPEQAAPLADLAHDLDALRHEQVRPSGALPKVSELRRTAAIRFASSGVVVQLGAYGSPSKLQAGWAKLSSAHKGVLGRYVPATARFNAPIGPVYRLSLQGFASSSEARSVCQGLKNAGAACFVRNVAGDAPIRFASR